MITSKIINFFKVLSIITFVFGLYYCINIPKGAGDEALFLSDLDLIKNNGWVYAIGNKISIPYMILVYPFSFLFEDFIALRLVNFILFGFLFLYFVKKKIVEDGLFYYILLFFSSTGWYLIGTNDVLFTIAFIVFFCETYLLLQDKSSGSNSMFWSSLLVAFFTRELFLIFLPAVFISFFLIYKKKHNLFRKLFVPIFLFVLLLFINVPSLVKNKSLSYDNKVPPKGIHSTWGQRQYLAQLLVNAGKLENHQHPSFKETDAYLKAHGDDSLPKTIVATMLFDVKLTVTEFFKDFAEVLFYSVRATGLIILLTLLHLLLSLYRRKIDYDLYIPLILFVTIALISLIIISYVEARWLVPVYIMALLYYSNNIKKITLFQKTFIANLLLTSFVMLFGIYRMYKNLH
ncbi:MAG: hypothetical protein K2P85_06030 [Flavobacteriaceae bacterium]|nr:hypothetical protein [Flavobacteriaceae bacterium]